MEPEPISHLSILFFQSTTFQDSSGLLFPLIIFFLLLLCSGLISGSEVAYFSLDIQDIKALEEINNAASKRALNLKQTPRYLLSTILIVNNFINIAIVLVSDFILKLLIGDQLLLSLAEWCNTYILLGYFDTSSLADIINFLITVVGVTFILVLFGEAMPKIYATLNKQKLVLLMSGPLTFLKYVMTPLSRVMVKWSLSMENALKNSNNINTTTKEDIDAAIDLTVTQHTESSAQEADILKGIVNFGDISVKEIMHSRMDIVAVDIESDFKELMKIVKDSGYSRLPVYQDDLDKIVGILYVKDLLPYLDEKDIYEWQTLIRKSLLFIPESKKIDELLKEFQAKRIHFAIVVDEYGGSAGIATLEDVMEEIVGDIKDEFDSDDNQEYIKIAENNYIFDGKTLIKDALRITGQPSTMFDNDRGESDSLAGLILETTGSIPSPDKEIKIGTITLKVVSVTKRRIEKISVTINEEQ